MAKVELRATKTFYNAGKFTIAGETFKVDREEVEAFISRDLAERAGTDQVAVEPPTEAPETTTEAPKAYEDMTVAELRPIAKNYNITGYYNMSKSELIDQIRAVENRAEGATE